MLLLTSTSDKVSVVSSAAGDLDVIASYVDRNTSTDALTPGRTLTGGITTATTTDVVTCPSTTHRNLQTLVINNVHASVTNTVTVRLTDGTTTVDVIKIALAAGETLQFLDGVGWQVLAVSGALKTAQNVANVATSSDLGTGVLGADVTNNNATANTIADVTGLSFPVTSGKVYWFKFIIEYTAAATTTGSRWSISGPGASAMRFRTEASLTTTTVSITEGNTAHDTPSAVSASSAATGGNIAVIEGFYHASASGSVIARFASEVASSAIVAKAGSIVRYQEVA